MDVGQVAFQGSDQQVRISDVAETRRGSAVSFVKLLEREKRKWRGRSADPTARCRKVGDSAKQKMYLWSSDGRDCRRSHIFQTLPRVFTSLYRLHFAWEIKHE